MILNKYICHNGGAVGQTRARIRSEKKPGAAKIKPLMKRLNFAK